MAKVQGDLKQGKGTLPGEIRRNHSPKTKEGDWKKVRKHKKDVAKAHRAEIVMYAQEMKQKVRNSDLPTDVKERLIDHIDNKVKHLKNPKSRIVQHYNGLADEIRQAQRALADETSKKTKGSKKSTKSSSAPPPGSYGEDFAEEAGHAVTEKNVGALEDNPDAGGADEASGSEKSGESEASASFEDFDPQEYARLMMEDPEAAMEMLDGMEPNEKTKAMNMGQDYLQQIQRMAQLQSNMMKMMHKTQSSIIRNIR